MRTLKSAQRRRPSDIVVALDYELSRIGRSVPAILHNVHKIMAEVLIFVLLIVSLVYAISYLIAHDRASGTGHSGTAVSVSAGADSLPSGIGED